MNLYVCVFSNVWEKALNLKNTERQYGDRSKKQIVTDRRSRFSFLWSPSTSLKALQRILRGCFCEWCAWTTPSYLLSCSLETPGVSMCELIMLTRVCTSLFTSNSQLLRTVTDSEELGKNSTCMCGPGCAGPVCGLHVGPVCVATVSNK